MATRSVLSRAATADTQKGCSKPSSPRSPWASRCRASGRFLERPHRATELWAESRVSESLGAGQRATWQEGTKCAAATRSRQVRSLPQRPHLCKGAAPAPDQGDFLCGKPRGRGGKQLLPVVCTRHHMLLVDELDAVDGAPEKGAVRGMAQPHPQPMLPPTLGTASRFTGGHRRQAGTPRGSSTHARSRPGPRRSHSTPCSEHLVLPRRPGARSWSRGQTEDEVTREPEHTRVHALSPGTLTASPRRSSPPHSTPSQSGHGTCCRAGGCLCGTPAPGGFMERGKKGTWATAGETEVRPREDALKSTSYGTGSQPSSRVLCGALCGARGTLICPCQASTDSSEASFSLGKLDSISPSSAPLLPPFLSYTPKCRFYEDEDRLRQSRHSLEPSTKPGPLWCLRNVH